MNNNQQIIKVLDWNDYHHYIDRLAVPLKNKQQYKHVAGLDPDDMIMAVHLSHSLSIPVITDMHLLSMLMDFGHDANQILVVSNVVQTGNTFNDIMKQAQCQFDTAVLFKDQNSKFNVTYFVEVPTDRIYFPWQKCGLDIEK